MTTEYDERAAQEAAPDPRTVSRGLNLHNYQIGFLGIDSLYLVVEYPHLDLFQFWSKAIQDFTDPALHEGIPYEHGLLRRGGLGYKLSVWDGDARLFLTDQVNEKLEGSPHAGHGMGVMLQLGPLWLRRFGEVWEEKLLKRCVHDQLVFFGMKSPEEYPIRINRMDLTLDLVGADINTLDIPAWEKQWVGYAHPRALHYKPRGKGVEGFAVGTSQGSVRFKVYDKVEESKKLGKYTFWHSVWGLPDLGDDVPVTRFEWSVKCYAARFVDLRYLHDYTFLRFLALLNYLTQKWGRLCIPQEDDLTTTRWPLAPLWIALRRLIDDWSLRYDEVAKRVYVFEPDIKAEYLRFVAGVLAGLQTRVGFEEGKPEPASLSQGLAYLYQEGYPFERIQQKAEEKWKVFAKLARRSDS